MKIIQAFLIVFMCFCQGCNTSLMSRGLPGMYGAYLPGYSIGWESCVGNADGIARFTVICSHGLAPQTLTILSGKDTYAVDIYGNRYQVTLDGQSSVRNIATGVPEKITYLIKGIPPGIHSFSIVSSWRRAFSSPSF